jgi:hypothetical protein
MPRLRLLRGSTGAMTEPDPAVRCQPKDAPALPPLSEHVGQRSGGSRRSFQLRSPNERCQYQLVARSRRHNERGGRRSRRRRRPEHGRKCSFSRHNPAPRAARPPSMVCIRRSSPALLAFPGHIFTHYSCRCLARGCCRCRRGRTLRLSLSGSSVHRCTGEGRLHQESGFHFSGALTLSLL